MPLEYTKGVYQIGSTITIPRIASGMAGGSRPTYDSNGRAVKPSFPGSMLRGDSWRNTTLDFNPGILGNLIQTEGYGSTSVTGWWDNGDPNSNVGSTCEQLKIIGNAQIRFDPEGYKGIMPDPHGPDFVPVANGLAMQGGNLNANHLKFSQIPGTAMVVREGNFHNASFVGPDDDFISTFDHIHVQFAYKGVDCYANDTTWDSVNISGIVKDAFTLVTGGKVFNAHLQAADRSLVFKGRSEAKFCYADAARIGTHFDIGSDGTVCEHLNIGPGTCWQNNVKIEANSITLSCFGGIMATTTDHTDIAGLYYSPASGGHDIYVNFEMQEGQSSLNASRFIDLRGHDHFLRGSLGWNSSYPHATGIKVRENLFGVESRLKFNTNGGKAADFTETTMNTTTGRGNLYVWTGNITQSDIIWPGGGSTYNLAAGNRFWLNGTLLAP